MNDGDTRAGPVTTNMITKNRSLAGKLIPRSNPPGGADGSDDEVITVINYMRIGQYRLVSRFLLRSIPTYRETHLSESRLPVVIGPEDGQSST